MRKYIFIVSTIILFLSSCSKEGLTQYDTEARYLYIPNDNDINTSYVTFMHHPDENDYDVFFEVKLAGLQLNEEKAYKVEVVKEKTTAKAEDFTLETEQIFHAGVLQDKLKITLHKTAYLDDETVSVMVRLVPNENFELASYMASSDGKQTLTAVVTFDNKLSKPIWWNRDIELNYLGVWSKTKHQRFIESCDGEVLDLTDYEGYQIQELAIKFKHDIELYGWLDEDGNLIDLPIK